MFFVHNSWKLASASVVPEVRKFGLNPPAKSTLATTTSEPIVPIEGMATDLARDQVGGDPMVKSFQKVGGHSVPLLKMSELGCFPISQSLAVEQVNCNCLLGRSNFRELWCTAISATSVKDIWPRN